MLRLGLPIALLWFVVDQATKWWILNHVMDPPRVIPITGFFNLVLGRNTGVSFGLFGDAPPWVLMVFALVVAAGLVVWTARAGSRLTATGFGLIVGGAMGNVLDRLQLGGVTDFLYRAVALAVVQHGGRGHRLRRRAPAAGELSARETS